MRVLLGAIAVLSASLTPTPSFAQKWTEATKSKGGDVYYIDFTSVAEEGAYLRAWVRTDYKEPERESDGWLTSRTEDLWVVDCKRKRFASKSQTSYNPSGRSRSETRGPPYKFIEPEDGTVGMGLVKRICGDTTSASQPAPKSKSEIVKFAEDDEEVWNYAPSTLKFNGARFEVVAFQSLTNATRDEETGKYIQHVGYWVEGNCSNSSFRATQRRSFDSKMDDVRDLPVSEDLRTFRRYPDKTVAFRLLASICEAKGYKVVAAPADSRSATSADNEKSSGPSSGSGFAVSATGHMLTNDHVVESCRQIFVSNHAQPRVRAEVLARDGRNDLALLKAPIRTVPFASFRSAPIRPGDSVVALGYPLKGLLASEVNVSTGTVSALAGLRNDTSKLQISAPIQPGNSGGPVLDLSASVAALAVEKLDALRVAKATGDIPSLVSFAIKSDIATSFMRSSGVEPSMAPSGMPRLEAADVAARGRPFTFLVECE